MAPRKVYRVRWANGRAVVCYSSARVARAAARRLGGRVSFGPPIGRVRTAPPPLRKVRR